MTFLGFLTKGTFIKYSKTQYIKPYFGVLTCLIRWFRSCSFGRFSTLTEIRVYQQKFDAVVVVEALSFCCHCSDFVLVSLCSIWIRCELMWWQLMWCHLHRDGDGNADVGYEVALELINNIHLAILNKLIFLLV